MKKTEQQLADELDQAITAVLQGDSYPTSQASPSAESRLAANLVQVAAQTEPDPTFAATLQQKLARRASQLKKSTTSAKRAEQASFWQDLQNLLKEAFTMKQLAALGALILVVVFVGVMAFRGNLFGNETEIAENTAVPVATTETDTDTEVAATTDANLPQLPLFTAQAGGLGSGGGDGTMVATEEMGGAEATSMPADFDMRMMNPFSGTNFILNSGLPTDILSGLVYQRIQSESIDQATAEAIASQYGFTGPLYIETYAYSEGLEPSLYIAMDIDGRRTLYISPWGINYTDDNANARFDYENPQQAANAVAIAESFLKERGQLEFAYVAETPSWDSVYFYRLIDGRKVNEPEITVYINAYGEIANIYDGVLGEWIDTGSYPLISAEAAWQKIMGGIYENNIQYYMTPANINDPIDYEQPDYMANYQYWQRPLVSNEEIHLYEWPLVYTPVDGSAPFVRVRNLPIIADEATLNSLAQNINNQVHFWGTVNEAGTHFQLAGWEPMAEYVTIFERGIVRQQNDQWIFYGSEGSSYILPNAPADLSNGLDVNVFAYNTRDIGLEHPVLDWESIETYIEYPNPEMPVDGEIISSTEDVQIMPIDIFQPMYYQDVQINEVSLVYYVTYYYPEMPETGGMDTFMSMEPPTIYVQPAWSFKGTAENGDQIQLFVQAVSQEYLQGGSEN